jgi:RNA polymerase sigma-70 factor (ECF subfamily)
MPFFKSTPSQDDLIQGCIRNDRRAQELLYKQYCEALLKICTSYSRSDEDAIEILQDGFLKIFQHIQKFDPAQSTLYTWMRTIMVRTAIDAGRKIKHEPVSTEWTEDHDLAHDGEIKERILSGEVLHLLQGLPEMARTVFNLFITEGYSHREISEMLQINEGTCRWHLSEARKFIIGNLKEQRA